jgi:hypothetical protein
MLGWEYYAVSLGAGWVISMEEAQMIRFNRQLNAPSYGRGEIEGWQEIEDLPVIASGDSAPVRELVEAPLNQVPLFIEFPVIPQRGLSVWPGRYDHNSSLLPDEIQDLVAVICFVGNHPLGLDTS